MGPVEPLLEQDDSLWPLGRPTSGQHLRRLPDLVGRHAGDLLRAFKRKRVVGLEIRSQPLERQAEHLPSPLGLLSDLIRRSGVLLDELAVLPALLDDVADDGVVEGGVCAELELQVEAAPLLREGGGEGLARVDVDDLRPAGGHPGGEAHRLRLVGVGAGDEQHVRLLVVLEGCAEGVDAGIGKPRHIVTLRRSVVWRVIRGADLLVAELRDGVHVLVELIRVALDAPGQLAVIFDDVLGHLGHDISGGVPGDGLQRSANPQERDLEPVDRWCLGVVELLGDRASPHAVRAAYVHHGGVAVRDDDHVVRAAIHLHHVVHVGRDPLARQLLHGEVDAEGVLVGGGAAFLLQRPGVDLVAARYGAVLAGDRADLRIGRRQRNLVGRLGDASGQHFTPAGVSLAHDRTSTLASRRLLPAP